MLSRILVCSLGLLGALAAVDPPKTYSDVVAFGDSITDNGIAYNKTHGQSPKDPAYYKGHYSNGPVWVEYLAERLQAKLWDYAVGGATSNNTRSLSKHNDVGGFISPAALDQLDQFLAQHNKTPNSPKIATTLFAINIGINDIYISGLTLPAKDVIDTVFYIVNKLKAINATNFLLTDVIDAADIPAASNIGPFLIPFFSYYASQFHSEMQSRAAAAGIPYYSFYNAIKNFQAQPQTYGFQANVTHTACFLDAQNSTILFAIPVKTPRSVCKTPSKYIFWDLVHPTTRAHSFLANGSYTALMKPV